MRPATHLYLLYIPRGGSIRVRPTLIRVVCQNVLSTFDLVSPLTSAIAAYADNASFLKSM